MDQQLPKWQCIATKTYKPTWQTHKAHIPMSSRFNYYNISHPNLFSYTYQQTP